MATMIRRRNNKDRIDKPQPVKIDDRGRISVPKVLRDKMKVESGDTLFISGDASGLKLRKAENPFDVVAKHAIKQYKEGRTRSIKDFAAEMGIDLDAKE